MASSPHLFVFGMGFTATVFARKLQEKGWQVSGTHQALPAAPCFYTPYHFDQVPPSALHEATHLLISIPPGEEGDLVLKRYQDELVKLPHLRWVAYLSTTGVYGDTNGAYVTEESPTSPNNDRLRHRVHAENQWLALWHTHQLPVQIFRLAGIYGKERSALTQVRNGTARRIDKPGQFFSRIHVEDIASVLLASMEHGAAGEIYNVADDYPCAQEEVVRFAAELLGENPPPLIKFEEAELSPMARSFYQNNRRISNEKIKTKLQVKLRYPTYREGLQASLVVDEDNFL